MRLRPNKTRNEMKSKRLNLYFLKVSRNQKTLAEMHTLASLMWLVNLLTAGSGRA